MSDSVIEHSSQGWLSRLGESIKGVLFGLVMVVVAFPLLGWNEKRAVVTARSLDEGLGAVITVAADPVDPANEGQLVHITGEATTQDVLADDVFGISEVAIHLIRSVEMYQWDERKETETKKKTGGGTETTTRYEYDRKWSERLIDSSNFRSDGHENPGRMRFDQRSIQAKKVELGAFTLSSGLIAGYRNKERLSMSAVPEAHAAEAVLADGRLYFGGNPAQPQIGDTRVSFEVVRPGPASVIAQQIGESFTPYQTKAGRALELVRYGAHTAEAMFQEEMRKNAMLTWALRGGGFLLMAFGIGLIFRPLAVTADVLPFLGNLLEMGIGLFAAVVAGALTLATIAIAWIAVRPLIAIPLLVAAVGLLVAPRFMGRSAAT